MLRRFADYGCILEIHSLEVLPDGRSFVDTVGGSRFRVVKRAQRDGYHTADIEYLEDLKVSTMKSQTILYYKMLLLDNTTTLLSSLSQVDDSELELLQRLHESVYQQAQEWYQRMGSRIREQINRQYGTMPEKEENIQVGAFT